MVCEMLGRFPHEVEAIPFRDFCRLSGYLTRKGERVKAMQSKGAAKAPKGRGPKRRARSRGR